MICIYSNRFKNDPWLWDLDWSVENFRLKKSYYDKLDRSASAEEIREEEKEDKEVKRDKTNERSMETLAGEDTKEEMVEDEGEIDEDRKLERVKEKLAATLAYLPKRSQHMVGYPR